MSIEKPRFQELGTLLRVVGAYMETTGVMPGVVVGEYRDHMGDETLIEQMEDAGIDSDRAAELLGLSLEEIARID
ncbi:hypothetical protein [Burkholderia sp. Ac-20344]|uniref:hypothetical protein n=1 Tax=Burkholderia sp. Ac-20344 TaxID=2703890 RepID=UPI00197B612B|nr:hypothetical protein [Burkholderia sp. Ac-20344]MBN3833658.1 hypothetical protein [Burkholderia sp. Ac-20344]